MSAPRRSSLAPGSPDDLFSEFEQVLVSNSGEDAFDAGIKLLAAKLEDELTARDDPAYTPRFRAGPTAARTHECVAR